MKFLSLGEKDLLGPQKPWSLTVETLNMGGGSLVVVGSSQLGDWLSGKVTLFPRTHYTQTVIVPDCEFGQLVITQLVQHIKNSCLAKSGVDLTYSTTVCFKTDHLGMNAALSSLVG